MVRLAIPVSKTSQTNDVEIMSAPTNAQKATHWLRRLVPSGPINIITATPEFTRIKTRTFTDDEAMTAHIEWAIDAGRSVFLQFNQFEDRDYREERTRKTGEKFMVGTKPKEEDAEFIRGLHLDFDWDEYFENHHGIQDIGQTRDAALDRIMVGAGLGRTGKGVPPTALNWSSTTGGFHGFWAFREPLPATPENIARVKALNVLVLEQMGLKPKTQDITRLLRVAHTMNFPTPKKDRGPEPVVPHTEEWDRRYSLDDFQSATPLKEKAKSTELEPVDVELTDIDQLGLLDHDTLALIAWAPPTYEPTPWGPAGEGFEEPPVLDYEEAQKYFDPGHRSERVLSVVKRLEKRKVPVEMIVGVLINPDYGVSAHILDQQDPLYAAWHNCRKIETPVIAGELVPLAPIPDDLTPPPIYVPGWLMDRKVSILAGRGGVGKSTLSLTLAVSCATGRPLLGFKPKERRKVLVLNTEDDIDIMHYRLWAICQEHGIDHRELEGWLFTKNLVSLELIAKVETDDGTEFIQTPLYKNILKQVEQHDIGLLIVDPFAETFDNCDENSNSDMKKVIIEHRKALALLGKPACLLLCHHTRKGYSQEGSEADAIRGGGSLVNHARYAQTLEPLVGDEKKSAAGKNTDRRFVKLTDAKRNYEREADKLVLEFIGHQHPTGFNVAAFVLPDLSVIDPDMDITLWDRYDETLEEVRRRYGTRPFSSATRGPRDVRLDAWLEDGLSRKDAKVVFQKLIVEALQEATWEDENRESRQVLVVRGDVLPMGFSEVPF